MGVSNIKDAGIGIALRRKRENLEWTLRRAATESGFDNSTISKWENGSRSPSSDDLSSYCTSLGMPQEERHELAHLLRRRTDPDWTAADTTEQWRQTITLIDLEQAATELEAVSMTLVPGLLQIPDYARQIMRRYGLSPEQVTSGVAMRAGRREVLDRERPARLHVYLGEHVLRQRIGGPQVMLAQYRHLYAAAEKEHITVRILPDNADWHPGLDGSFVLIHFRHREPIVQINTPHNVTFTEDESAVELYRGHAAKVADAALDPESSLRAIAAAISTAESESDSERTP